MPQTRQGIRYVQQEDKYGCAPACLAMIAGVTYQQAKALWPKQNFKQAGVSRRSLDRALALAGYAVARREGTSMAELVGCVHLVEVQSKHDLTKKRGAWHWIIVFKDGKAFDPDERGLASIDDYYHVRAIAAVVPVTPGA